MEFDDVLKKRCSIRKYSTKKVSFSDIIKVCEASRYAPMAGNIHTLVLVIVSDKKKKIELGEAAVGQSFIADAPYIIVVCSNLGLVKRSYGTRGEIYARQQAGAAIENMLLKVIDLGLASCWIGAFDENLVKRILGIPDHDIQVEALLPIGNPTGKNEPRKKMDLKLFTYYEKWGQRTEKPIIKPGAA
ncbi:MAG: nitroreductase family protein [Candidatus Pacearchaeota archaeon]|nr:nitroreductase family protein [Candidatus Pacearchaeota archaeon]